MNIHQILKAAAENEVEPRWAIQRRSAYLSGQLVELKFRLDEELNFDCLDDVEEMVFTEAALDTAIEIGKTKKELKTLTQWVERGHRKETITDEMIQAARKFPVNMVVEFVRGKATAWCHDDRNPSLYYGTRKNVAVCPVCDKKFSALDVLISRDGMTFVEAVKYLQ